MATFFDVLYRTLSILRGERNGIAGTSTNATTLVCTTISDPNDYFNNGTILFLTGAAAGLSRVISDWNSLSYLFTFATASPAPQEGNHFAAFDMRYTRQAIVQAVNRALQTLGPLDEIDQTTTTTADTERYTLPAGVAGVRKVQIATSSTSPYLFGAPRHDWYERDGYLYFEDYPNIPTGFLIRITYGEQPTRIYQDADTIPAAVDAELLAACAAYEAARARYGFAGSSDPETQVDLQIATQYRTECLGRYPILKSKRDSRYVVLP